MYKNYRPGFPGERHIPCYNFCGPGTHYETRIKRGDKPVNALDACCKIHDSVYNNARATNAQIKASDEMLMRCAKKHDLKSGRKGYGLIVNEIFKRKGQLVDAGLVDRDIYSRARKHRRK